MGAIQAARIKGAAQVIVIEPIAYRREIAMKVGATMVLDPNQYNDRNGAALVDKIQDLCKGPTDRRFAGGRTWAAADRVVAVPKGPDFTIEAVGGDTFPPKGRGWPRSKRHFANPTGVQFYARGWSHHDIRILAARQTSRFLHGSSRIVDALGIAVNRAACRCCAICRVT